MIQCLTLTWKLISSNSTLKVISWVSCNAYSHHSKLSSTVPTSALPIVLFLPKKKRCTAFPAKTPVGGRSRGSWRFSGRAQDSSCATSSLPPSTCFICLIWFSVRKVWLDSVPVLFRRTLVGGQGKNFSLENALYSSLLPRRDFHLVLGC